jgi:hypothetical protein
VGEPRDIERQETGDRGAEGEEERTVGPRERHDHHRDGDRVHRVEKVFRLDPNFRTPAHEFEDGVDFVPTNRFVLWGHHFTSVAGAAPIVGPAIAVIWGWLPAFLWVVLGTVFFAGVHDAARSGRAAESGEVDRRADGGRRRPRARAASS